jgi:hypothetical protein
MIKVSGVTFVCINMHFEFARGISSNQKISKHGATRSVDNQTHSVTIRDTKVICVCLTHMDMPLGAYDALSEINCTSWTNKYTAGCSANLSAGPYGKVNAKGDTVCERQFNL